MDSSATHLMQRRCILSVHDTLLHAGFAQWLALVSLLHSFGSPLCLPFFVCRECGKQTTAMAETAHRTELSRIAMAIRSGIVPAVWQAFQSSQDRTPAYEFIKQVCCQAMILGKKNAQESTHTLACLSTLQASELVVLDSCLNVTTADLENNFDLLTNLPKPQGCAPELHSRRHVCQCME